jgi:hypothetical protein
MKKFYSLNHTRKDDERDVNSKHIGIFSSEDKAQEAIHKLMLQPGFKDGSVEWFEMDEFILDKIYWGED